MSDPQTSIGPHSRHSAHRRHSAPLPRPLEAAVRTVLGLQPGQTATEAELVAGLLARHAEGLRTKQAAREWQARIIDETGCCPACGYPTCLGACWLRGWE